ncbi:MAG TPA: hypothetical protein VG205_00305 [Acidimicrobiales bacterium]|nr:hypothetical protein [Acidimicrobiales bacterium]
MSPVNLVLVAGSLIGGYALIGVLLNVSRSFSTIKGAEWGWVIGASCSPSSPTRRWPLP